MTDWQSATHVVTGLTVMCRERRFLSRGFDWNALQAQLIALNTTFEEIKKKVLGITELEHEVKVALAQQIKVQASGVQASLPAAGGGPAPPPTP